MYTTRREVEDSLLGLQEDYNQCFKTIKKTYEHLNRIGLKEFNKRSKYKWNYDHDKDCSYVCIRFGNSLSRKILVKSSAYLEEPELYQWIEEKDFTLEALEEAYEYIRKKIRLLKSKMEAVKEHIQAYDDRLKDLADELDGIPETYKELGE
ncbi:MAG: hypothetical protein LBD37_07205 [Treponema sp.]|jgi:predicted RNase H-like nuclease (RuvC/YqgF family)|nr:hypothetical protein [Treponema sp.]